MKKLIDYYNGLNRKGKDAFLAKVDGLTENYLRSAVSRGIHFREKRCKQVEEATKGAVTRYDLRPDAKEIWG